MQSPASEQENQQIEQQNVSSNADLEANNIIQTNQLSINSNFPNHQISVKPFLAMITFMVFLFVVFIIWMVKILSSMQDINDPPSVNNLTKSESDSIISPSTMSQQFIENLQDGIQNFIKQNNINNQPVNLFFAKYLLQNFTTAQQEEERHIIQKKYYTKLYGNDFAKQRQEKPLCVVSTGRNNMGGQRQKRFLDSVQKMNYSNYRLVYVDDDSSDQTYFFSRQYVTESKKLMEKSQIIQRDKRYYVLANKIKAITQYCQENDIIIDVDADDQFIGRQVFNIINYLYTKNQQIWFLYTNHLILEKGNISLGKNRGLTQEEVNKYRTSGLWVTSHLKTFIKKIFMKIDRSDWLREEDGEVCHWASDRYLMYALVQLAGPIHTQFENVLLYLYDYGAAGDVRNFEVIKPDKIRSQLLNPYGNLQSLDEKAQKIKNYEPPAQLKQSYRRAQLKYAKLKENGVQQ